MDTGGYGVGGIDLCRLWVPPDFGAKKNVFRALKRKMKGVGDWL